MTKKKNTKKAPVEKKPVVVKKPVKKAVAKKAPAKKAVSPLNSKTALADLRKRYDALAKLNIERAIILEDIAKKEAALGEVLDMNLAKFDENGHAVPPACPKSQRPFDPGAISADGTLANAIAIRQ